MHRRHARDLPLPVPLLPELRVVQPPPVLEMDRGVDLPLHAALLASADRYENGCHLGVGPVTFEFENEKLQ